MSENNNNQTTQDDLQSTIQQTGGNNTNPFENLSPAEIPTKMHTFSQDQQGEKRNNDK